MMTERTFDIERTMHDDALDMWRRRYETDRIVIDYRCTHRPHSFGPCNVDVTQLTHSVMRMQGSREDT